MSFEEKVQQWVSLDNQLKIVNEKAKAIRDKKNTLNEHLQSYAEQNNLTGSTIQITDGRLKFVDTRVHAPITFKYLEKSLGEIIQNETQVKQIIEYLKQKREIKIVSEIKRF